MTWRILEGQRTNGTFGFDVSKPGFDVLSANIMQMAFSSDCVSPLVVAQGTLAIPPILNDPSHAVYGQEQATGTVSYGRTISPAPFVVAVATASSWPLPIFGTSGTQYGFLDGVWHTYVLEQPPIQSYPAFDSAYPIQIRRNSPLTTGSSSGNPDGKNRGITFASCKFISNVYLDRVEFLVNCQNTVYVKYLVMEV